MAVEGEIWGLQDTNLQERGEVRRKRSDFHVKILVKKTKKGNRGERARPGQKRVRQTKVKETGRGRSVVGRHIESTTKERMGKSDMRKPGK